MAELSYIKAADFAREIVDACAEEILNGVTAAVTADGKISIPFEQFLDLAKAKIKLNTATAVLRNVKDYEKADYVDELLLKEAKTDG